MIPRLLAQLPVMAFRCLLRPPNVTLTFVSEGCEFITGYRPSELQRNRVVSYSDLIHPDDRDSLWAGRKESLKASAAHSAEYRIIHKGGDIRWVCETGRGLYGVDGSLVGIEGLVQDISVRKNLERERNRLFQFSLDLLCIAGFDGYFKQVNPAWSTTLGWSEAQLLGSPWLEFVHPDDREETRRAGAELSEGTPVVRFENRYRCPDGSYRWLAWNSYPLPQEQMIFAIARDITETKKLETELAESRDLLRNVLDDLPSSVFVFDLNHRFTLVNKAMANFYGMDAESLIGKTLHDVFPESLADRLLSINRQVMEIGVPIVAEEEVMSRLQLVPRTMWTSKSALRDSQGKTIGLCGVATDITDRKKDAEVLRRQTIALEHASRLSLVGQMVGAIAHEVNQPLGAAANLIYVANQKIQLHLNSPVAKIGEDLIRAGEAIDRACRVLRNMLSLIRRQTPLAQVLDLNLLVEESAKFLDSTAREKGIEIRLVKSPPVLVKVSRVGIQQSICNLLVNAIDAIDANGCKDRTIAVTIRPSDKSDGLARVIISDSGPGVPKGIQAGLFEPFTTGGNAGHGLGLWICRMMVEMDNGRITFEPSEGPGAVFTISFTSVSGPIQA